MRRRGCSTGGLGGSQLLERPAQIVLAAVTCFCMLVWLVQLGPGAWADGAQRGNTRLALVIGNGSYQASPLATSVNDAGLVAQTLAQAGFDITAAANADAITIRKLFDGFAAKLQSTGPNTVAVVYLTGYGLQVDGNNFFVPVDANINRDSDVPNQAVSLSDLARSLQATPARVRILVYDLARAGPFPVAGLALASGLNVAASPDGTLTAFNVSPGMVAEPDLAPYGVYARALAEMIQTPGLQSSATFDRVRLRVVEQTNGRQIPYHVGHLDFSFYPNGASSLDTTPEVASVSGMPIADAFAKCVSRDSLSAFNEFTRAFPNDPLAIRVRRMTAIRREVLIWSESLQANTPRSYWTYMRRYPRGPHFGDARRKLTQLNAALEPPPRFDIYDYPDLQPPTAEELAIIGERNVGSTDATSIPPLPSSFLPQRRNAFTEELPPPPILPEHVLPIPVPVARSSGTEAAADFGSIVQPDAPGGSVTTSTRGTTVVVKGTNKLISQTSESIDQGTRILLQTGDHGEAISRTTTTYDRGTIVTVQRGPSGRVLTETVTRSESDGDRSTTLLDGQSRLIGQMRADTNGIVKIIERGSVPVPDQVYVLSPSAGSTSSPVVVTLAQLQAPGAAVRKEQAKDGFASPNSLFPSAAPALTTTSQMARPTAPLPLGGGDTATKLSKMPSMQPSSAERPASPQTTRPKFAVPVQTGAPAPIDPPPPAAAPVPSPTGGATLSAIPPTLRDPSAGFAKPPLPGVAAPPPSPQPAQTTSPGPSVTTEASPQAIPASTPAMSVEIKTPSNGPLPATGPVPSILAMSNLGPAAVINTPPTPTVPVAPVSPPSVTTEARLAPTDAPPSRLGPLDIEPEMFLPSRRLPSAFQPPAQPALILPADAPPPVLTSATSAPALVQQPRQTPSGSEQPTVTPTQPPSSPGAEASASSATGPQRTLPSIAVLPAEPPMPPPRLKLASQGQPHKRPSAEKRHAAPKRRPNSRLVR